MDPLLAITIIFIVFAVGDIIAVKTKSIVSMLFTASVFFLIAFWSGLPATIFQDSTLLALGSLMISFLLVHMGTLLNLKQLKEQWKTVLICTFALIGVAVGLFIFVAPFTDIPTVLTGAPPLSGGVIAAIQMSEAANAVNRPDLALLASIIVVVQGFIGYPVASFALKKEADNFTPDSNLNNSNNKEAEKEEGSKIIPATPKRLQSDNVYLAKIAIVALLSSLFSQLLTSLVGFQIIDANIMALIFGLIFSEIGFLENDILQKSNSYGLAMAALIVVILSNLATTSIDMFLGILTPLVLILIFGSIGNIIFSLIIGKFLKISPWMSIALGITALFGFPGTVILPHEVANANFEDDILKQQFLDQITAPMLVGGFITVSIGSVIMAGFFGPLLINLIG